MSSFSFQAQMWNICLSLIGYISRISPVTTSLSWSFWHYPIVTYSPYFDVLLAAPNMHEYGTCSYDILKISIFLPLLNPAKSCSSLYQGHPFPKVFLYHYSMILSVVLRSLRYYRTCIMWHHSSWFFFLLAFFAELSFSRTYVKDLYYTWLCPIRCLAVAEWLTNFNNSMLSLVLYNQSTRVQVL